MLQATWLHGYMLHAASYMATWLLATSLGFNSLVAPKGAGRLHKWTRNPFIQIDMTFNFIFRQGLPGTCLYKSNTK